jgi:hypothetical protein
MCFSFDRASRDNFVYLSGGDEDPYNTAIISPRCNLSGYEHVAALRDLIDPNFFLGYNL